MVLSSPDFRMKPHSRGYVCHKNSSAVKIKNAFNNSGAKIYAGMPITIDSNINEITSNFECPNVKNWTSTSTPILGFSVQPSVVDYNDDDEQEYFETGRPVAWVDDESITMPSLTTFTPAQSVAVRMYSTGVNLGSLRNTAIAGQTVLLAGCKIESVDFYNGLYYCKLNLSGNISFTPDV